MEGFARYGYILFPYEDHQRYAVKKTAERGLFLKMKINGRSAIGEIFKGQKTQVAVFGASNLFYGVSSIDKTWPELLKKTSLNKIHVDNFGYTGQSLDIMKEKLSSLCSLRRFYDISIINHSYIFRKTHSSFGYQNRFKPTIGSFQTYQKLKTWYKRGQIEILFSDLFITTPFHALYYDLQDIVMKKNLQSQLQQFFVSHAREINQKRINELSVIIQEISDKAHCISDKVFWITAPFAWSKDMLESYKDIYYHIEKIRTEPYFLFADYKSLGQYFVRQKNTIKNIVQQNTENITFIDLFDLFQKEMSKTPNLFFDETHLSEEGHELVLKSISPYLLNYISE